MNNLNQQDPFQDESEYWDYHFSGDPACDICGFDPCECYDGICCFDPRYTGQPGTCRCAAYEKELDKERTWLYKKMMTIRWWVYNKFHDIKNWNHKTTCPECNNETPTRKWKDGIYCPKCGWGDLPF